MPMRHASPMKLVEARPGRPSAPAVGPNPGATPRRSRRGPRAVLSWLPLTAAAALGIAALALERIDGRGGAPTDWAIVPIMLTYAAAGSLIARRQPGNAVAWLLEAMSLAMCSAFFVARYAVVGYDHVLPLPGVWITGALGWTWVFAIACPIFIAFVVPTGRPANGRWRAALAASVVIFVGVEIIFALGDAGYEIVGSDVTQGVIPNPIYVPALAPAYRWVNETYAIYLGLFALGGAALVRRFEASRGIERQQLKWVVAGIVLMIGLMTASNALPSPFGDAAFTLAMACLPISLGIAILRYRLYDIDRIISRTLAYALVTATLAAVFGTAILVLQGVLAPVTGRETLSVAGSTLLAAALFQPLRRRIQTAIDRRFNRARYDAEREVEAFAARVRDEVQVGRVADALTDTMRDTMAPRIAGVWLRRDAA
jgi:uncharacterized membrane protein